MLDSVLKLLKVFDDKGYIAYAVGGFVMDWEPTKSNTMTVASIKDISKYSTSVADYLTQINSKYAKYNEDGIKALYLIENYELNYQPLNASMAPALIHILHLNF